MRTRLPILNPGEVKSSNQSRAARALGIFGAALASLGMLGFAPELFGATITFENLADSSAVTTGYAGLGVTFDHTTVLTAGVSLNELDFPPHSGVNVVFDDGGPITGSFSIPVESLSAYFTYVSPITLSVFDSGGNLLGSINSTFAQNTASSGNPPNELLAISLSSDIASFQIAGDPAGGSFVMDDFTFAGPAGVPDGGPSWAMLLLPFFLFVANQSLRKRTQLVT